MNLFRQEVLIFKVELPKPAQIRPGVTRAEFGRQSSRQICQQGLAVIRFRLAPLLLLDNLPTDEPVLRFERSHHKPGTGSGGGTALQSS
jgi:hypothetical protein